MIVKDEPIAADVRRMRVREARGACRYDGALWEDRVPK